MLYDGIQYIGDPHASSTRPGRRKDNYMESTLGKLQECADRSHSMKLKTVILGDLFHTASESKLRLLNRLSRILRSFYGPVHIVVGNHDHVLADLSDDDALTFIFEAGSAFPLVLEDVPVADKLVRLIGVGHGYPIPTRVDRGTADTVNLVTHHDMAFGGAYPGSTPLTDIAGVDFVVNGHMHDTKKSVVVGTTVWHNPGNIEPLSVDSRTHEPAFWVWRPTASAHALEKHAIAHDKDCFDMTGLSVEASDAMEAVQALPSMAVSTPGEFATQLASEDTLAAQQTDDAAVLAEDLTSVLDVSKVNDATALLLRTLLGRVQEKALAA